MLSWVAYMRGGKKPTSEVGLLEALAKHIFGREFTPDLMKTVVLARTSLAEDALQAAAESPIMVGDMSEALEHEIEDMHLQNEIKQYQENVRVKCLSKMHRREALSASMFQCAPTPGGGAHNGARQKQRVDSPRVAFRKRLPNGFCLQAPMCRSPKSGTIAGAYRASAWVQESGHSGPMTPALTTRRFCTSCASHGPRTRKRTAASALGSSMSRTVKAPVVGNFKSPAGVCSGLPVRPVLDLALAEPPEGLAGAGSGLPVRPVSSSRWRASRRR